MPLSVGQQTLERLGIDATIISDQPDEEIHEFTNPAPTHLEFKNEMDATEFALKYSIDDLVEEFDLEQKQYIARRASEIANSIKKNNYDLFRYISEQDDE